MLFTPDYRPCFLTCFIKYDYVRGGKAAFVFANCEEFRKSGHYLPRRAIVWERGLCWSRSTSPHVWDYGTSHPESSIQKEFFNKFVQHYTIETFFWLLILLLLLLFLVCLLDVRRKWSYCLHDTCGRSQWWQVWNLKKRGHVHVLEIMKTTWNEWKLWYSQQLRCKFNSESVLTDSQARSSSWLPVRPHGFRAFTNCSCMFVLRIQSGTTSDVPGRLICLCSGHQSLSVLGKKRRLRRVWTKRRVWEVSLVDLLHHNCFYSALFLVFWGFFSSFFAVFKTVNRFSLSLNHPDWPESDLQVTWQLLTEVEVS